MAKPRDLQLHFASLTEFSGSYIVPQNNMNTASHEISGFSRLFNTSHRGWVYGANPIIAGVNTNHRGYPTLQFHKSVDGAIDTPCYISLWVWLDADLKTRTGGVENDWFSIATLARSDDDVFWDGVLVNINSDRFVHLMHVPSVGQSTRIFQTTTRKFPMKTWVHIQILIDMNPATGYAKVWQDGELVSHALVSGGDSTVPQMHFGLYAAPSVAKLEVFNDNLIIVESFS